MDPEVSSQPVNINKANRSMKVCAYCGLVQYEHLLRHQKKHGNIGEAKVWIEGEDLLDQPHCSNWMEITKDTNIAPLDRNLRYATGGDRKSMAGSARGSTISKSQAGGLIYQNRMAEMEDDHVDNQDEENFVINSSPPKRQKTSKPVVLDPNHTMFQLPFLGQSKPYNINWFDINSRLYNLAIDKDMSIMTKRIQLLQHCSHFTNDEVAKAVKSDVNRFAGLVDIFRSIYTQDFNMYSELQIAGIITAAMIFKGSLWTELPSIIQTLNEKLETAMLMKLKDILVENGYITVISDWICSNILSMDHHTLAFVDYVNQLAAKGATGNDLTFEQLICMSQAVSIREDDIPTFYQYFQFLHQYQPAAYSCLIDCCQQTNWSKQTKLSFDDFAVLIDLLSRRDKQYFIKNNKLQGYPIDQWITVLNSQDVVSLIEDTTHIGKTLSDLRAMNHKLVGYDPLPEAFTAQLMDQRLYHQTFHNCVNPPNKLQFAIAMFAVGHLSKHKNQLINVPSGQGKSRITHTVGLLELGENKDTNVHFLYHDEVFAIICEKMFTKWWIFNSMEKRVKYHWTIDALEKACKPGDLVVVDEGDVFVFGQTDRFTKLLKTIRSISFSGTISNNDNQGIEKLTLDDWSITPFMAYDIAKMKKEGKLDWVDSVKEIVWDEQIDPHSDDELVNILTKESQIHPILVWCSTEHMNMFKYKGLDFFHMERTTPGIETICNESLDKSIKSVELNGNVLNMFPFIVATSEFAMRSWDYRASQEGLSLFILKPFAHDRDAVQGVNRVGRFGDKCRRVKLRTVEIVDKELQHNYYTQLNKVHIAKEKADERLAAEKQQKIKDEEERKIQEELLEKKKLEDLKKQELEVNKLELLAQLKQSEEKKAQEATRQKKKQEQEEKKKNKATKPKPKPPNNSKKATPATGKAASTKGQVSLFSFLVSNNISKQQIQAPSSLEIDQVEFIDQDILEGLMSQPDQKKQKKQDEALLFGETQQSKKFLANQEVQMKDYIKTYNESQS